MTISESRIAAEGNAERGETGAFPGQQVILGTDQPLRLDSGVLLPAFPVAYQTYGRLNDEGSNAVYIC
ncbi:MAG: homoserine O-acetyltransferase, partial [Rhodospirillales bacterium]